MGLYLLGCTKLRGSGFSFPAFKRCKGLFCRNYHLRRHSRHTRNVQSEAVGHASLHHLAEENHLLAHFLHCNVEILHTGEGLLHIVEFVIVGGEKGLCPLTVFVDVLHYGPGYGHSVVSGGSTADFIQQHQGPGRNIMQNHSRLQHLDHKGGLPSGYVVRCTHPGENLVETAHNHLFRRHE